MRRETPYEKFRRVVNLDDHLATRPAPPHPDRDFRPGDLRLAVGPDENRCVLIRSVHEEHLQVHLVHPYPEYATGYDRTFHLAAPRWPVVVQLDLLGCIWREQALDLVTRIPDWGTVGIPGPDVRGPLDARRIHKQAELAAFTLLVGDCTATRLEALWADASD